MKTEKDQIVIILYKAYLLDFLLNFLELYMQIIVLVKLDPMVESACLCSKPFRNGSLQKIAIIHHKRLKQKANVPLFCLEHISLISYSIFRNFIWKLNYSSSPIQWWNPCVCAQNRLEMAAVQRWP